MSDPARTPDLSAADLSAEDRKLLTLARAARARTGAVQGAAVRDGDGRTYAASAVELPSLRLSALQVCVAMAAASGSTGLEAAVLLGDAQQPTADDLAALADLGGRGGAGGSGVPVHLATARGELTASTSA